MTQLSARALGQPGGTTPAPRRPGVVRVFVLTLLATLAVQAAWVLVVSPFRGIDEHDHSYKAAAVAQGDWSWHHDASPDGWGSFVRVPRDIVEAARPVCQDLPYTTDDNCLPGRDHGDGTVQVASSASQYNPVFYALVGTAARPFSGYDALYVMRATAALLCALLLALAAATTSGWARSAWPLVALLLAETPVVLYSTSVAAPNGIELCGAAVVWTALLGLARSSGDAAAARRLATIATVGALPLVTVRTLGPLWLLLIVATAGLLVPRVTWSELLRSGWVRGCAATIAVATSLAVTWTLLARPNSLTSEGSGFDDSLATVVPRESLLWVLQSVAAFPARNEPASPLVYAIALVALWVFGAVALRRAATRERFVMGLVVAASAAVPIAFTVATYATSGSIWQGRYGYPYAMGLWLVCGLVLDRASGSVQRAGVVAVGAGAVFGSAQLLSQVGVLDRLRRENPFEDSDAWLQPSPWLVACLTLAGTLLLAAALANASRGPSRAGLPRQEALAATHRSRVATAAPESTAARARPMPRSSASSTGSGSAS